MEKNEKEIEISEATESEIEKSDEAEDEKKPLSVGAKVCKGFGIAFEVILFVFLVLCIFVLVFSVKSKKDSDGAIAFFGYEMRIVTSSSMEKSDYSVDVSDYKIKSLKVKSMVYIKKVPSDPDKAYDWYSRLKVGDVLTFKYKMGSTQEVITHRIVAIEPTDTGFIIDLQGDNRSSENVQVNTQRIYTSPDDYRSDDGYFNHVIGKVVGSSNVLGHIVYALKQPVGIALIIIVPCAIIIVWQIVRIVLMVTEKRRSQADDEIAEAKAAAEKEAEEREKQARELEELRRKVAELEKSKSDGGEK